MPLSGRHESPANADRHCKILDRAFQAGGEGAGIEEILNRHADLKTARSIYQTCVEQYPRRLIMLCDGTRVLARSDRRETMRSPPAAEIANPGP
jgi:hypothetical protein